MWQMSRKDIFCQMDELCKCLLQNALSYVFVFQMHNELFNGVPTTPLGNWDLSAIWCTEREKFTAFCGSSLPCHHLEEPIVVNICCFGLPSVYSLIFGNRFSTFFGGKSLPHCQSHNLSGLIPPPTCRVSVWPGAWSISVCSLLDQGWSCDPRWANKFNSGIFLLQLLGKRSSSVETLWGCRFIVVGGHLVIMNEKLAWE